MEILRCVSSLLSSNMYMLEENGHAVVIDPFGDAREAEGLLIDRILLTHEHYDHISGVNAWSQKTGAPVLCSKSCAENIQSPRRNLARIFEAFCQLQTWVELERIPESDPDYTCSADESFEDRISFVWQGHDFELFELPGHSAGSIGILADGEILFAGDSLIAGREVELRFPGGSKSAWECISKPRLMALPDGLHVYPGHFEDFIFRKESIGS